MEADNYGMMLWSLGSSMFGNQLQNINRLNKWQYYAKMGNKKCQKSPSIGDGPTSYCYVLKTIKFISDLWQVGDWNIVESGAKHHIHNP
jgi:hypothetical protein